MKLSVLPFATEAEAKAKIGQIDAVKGYPRTERGVRVGGGRFVESVTTLTDTAPVKLADGRWAVSADRLGAAGMDVSKAASLDLYMPPEEKP